MKFYKRFRDDTAGFLTVELVIIVPLMLFWFAGTFVFFNAFHKWLKSVKANYVIADLISRQKIIDNDFIYALDDIFDYVAAAEDPDNNYFVVTALQWGDTDNDPATPPVMAIMWSESTKTAKGHPTGITNEMVAPRMPSEVPAEDQLILVQSYTPYTPLFDWVGIPPLVFESDMVSPFRFTVQVDHLDYADVDYTGYDPDTNNHIDPPEPEDD